jgi:hypothetical protein
MYTSSTTIGHLKRYFSSPTYIGIIPSVNVTSLNVTLTKQLNKGRIYCLMEIRMGHVHEDHELTYTTERINEKHRVYLKEVLMIRTPTYKEEYNEGKGGWHVERGAPPKALGGRWLEMHPQRTYKDYTDNRMINAFTYKTL